MALSQYVTKIYPFVNGFFLSCLVIIVITVIHAINLKAGSLFQRKFTIIKVVCIIVFIGFGLAHQPSHHTDFSLRPEVWPEVFSAAFAGSLIYVTYAYSGWNAAAYISGEIRNASKNLPRNLFTETLVVMVIYTLLNYVFLYTVPVGELKGKLEVGYLSAGKIFDEGISQFMCLVIALLLVSTISAMIMAGPRVMQRMGNTVPGLSFFARANKNKVPYVAIIFQPIIALILLGTSSFQSLITYVSFTLNLFTFLTVFGVFILRYKHKHVKTSCKTPCTR